MTALVPASAVVAFCKFICARERHRVAKVAGRRVGKPDPIITKYRFCNVRRNDDRVTQWIHENYLKPWRDNTQLWFALVVARLFNNEDTLAALKEAGVIFPYNPLKMRRELQKRADAGLKNFNAAYIVSTNGRAMNKIEYVIDFILTPLWKQREFLSNRMNVGQLANCHLLLEEQNGLGSFMAAQVLADLKYAHPAKWEDFHTFAASGPGSRRGLNRLLGNGPVKTMSESAFRATLAALRDSVNRRLSWEPITAQDIQNCICEFDKYERVRLGEGEPKQLYKPKENTK